MDGEFSKTWLDVGSPRLQMGPFCLRGLVLPSRGFPPVPRLWKSLRFSINQKFSPECCQGELSISTGKTGAYGIRTQAKTAKILIEAGDLNRPSHPHPLRRCLHELSPGQVGWLRRRAHWPFRRLKGSFCDSSVMAIRCRSGCAGPLGRVKTTLEPKEVDIAHETRRNGPRLSKRRSLQEC
jgi:hypothetical protein